MKVSVILAHPDQASLNHALAQTSLSALKVLGHEVYFHDLYREQFDPILPKEELPSSASLSEPIATYCREISESDGIVLIHPNWWGQPPAILKGWIDRVLRAGVAYRFLEGDSGEGIPLGLLRAQTAVIFNTSNTPAEREKAVFGDPLQALWQTCTLEFCGVKAIRRVMFGVVVTSTPKQRTEWLKQAGRVLAESFPPAS